MGPGKSAMFVRDCLGVFFLVHIQLFFQACLKNIKTFFLFFFRLRMRIASINKLLRIFFLQQILLTTLATSHEISPSEFFYFYHELKVKDGVMALRLAILVRGVRLFKVLWSLV